MSEIRVHFRPSFDTDEDGFRIVYINCSAFYASDEEVIEDTDAVEYFNETRLLFCDGDGQNGGFGSDLTDFLREIGWSTDETDLAFVVSAVLNSAELRHGTVPNSSYLP